MNDTVERFSNRVANYVKYRPSYPPAIIEYLKKTCGLTKSFIVADVGCGTGISSRMFLENRNRVIGVEPNAAMRKAATEFLADFPQFEILNGTSEATSLPDASVDIVVAAQSFHWFDPAKTRPEFYRILRPRGHIVLIWNERQLDTTPFLIGYESLLVKYAYDYGNVRHENIKTEEMSGFFQREYRKVTFQNAQIFDFEGIKGRMLSSSYMPLETDRRYDDMIRELHRLFANHAENGKIGVFYDTNVYVSQV